MAGQDTHVLPRPGARARTEARLAAADVGIHRGLAQGHGPVGNDAGICVWDEGVIVAIRKRARGVHDILLYRLCDFHRSFADDPNPRSSLLVPSYLRDHLGRGYAGHL